MINFTNSYISVFRDGKVQIDKVDPLETWAAMEELVEEGLVKAIGNNISYIYVKHILLTWNKKK